MLPKLIRSHSLKAKFPSIAHSSGFRLRNPPPLFAINHLESAFGKLNQVRRPSKDFTYEEMIDEMEVDFEVERRQKGW